MRSLSIQIRPNVTALALDAAHLLNTFGEYLRRAAFKLLLVGTLELTLPVSNRAFEFDC